MNLIFTPKSDTELLNLLDPGIYDFEVVKAENAISKSTGNPMIKLTNKIYDKTGKEIYLNDYLVPSALYKIKKFCDSTNLQKQYNAGNLSPFDCEKKTGKCKIGVERSGDYPARNKIADYIKISLDFNTQTKDNSAFVDDDLPF